MAERSRHLTLRIPRPLAYAGLALALSLPALEMGFRVSDGRKLSRRKAMLEVYLADGTRLTEEGLPAEYGIVHHPFLTFAGLPGTKGPSVTVNEDGFRGPRLARPKPEGTYRIAILGDSGTFGAGASSDAHTYSAVLERLLNAAAASGPRRFEVLNAGVSGYTAQQQVLLYATEVSSYEPDLVIAVNGYVDFNLAYMTPAGTPLYPSLFSQVDRLAAGASDPLERALGWSAAYQGIRRRLEREDRHAARREAAGGAEGGAGEALELPFHPDAIPTYRRSLQQIIRLARANGAEAAICTHPEMFSKDVLSESERQFRDRFQKQFVNARRYRVFVQAAREAAEGERALFLDGRQAFTGAAEGLFLDSVHFNDQGHERMAEFLLEAVRPIVGLPKR